MRERNVINTEHSGRPYSTLNRGLRVQHVSKYSVLRGFVIPLSPPLVTSTLGAQYHLQCIPVLKDVHHIAQSRAAGMVRFYHAVVNADTFQRSSLPPMFNGRLVRSSPPFGLVNSTIRRRNCSLLAFGDLQRHGFLSQHSQCLANFFLLKPRD